jgi:transposase
VTTKKAGPARAQPTRLRRPGRRYPSDLGDDEWAVLEPLLPPVRTGGRGRPPVHSRRAIINAILYAGRAGCAWRYLPSDFPPWRTVYGYFAAWRDDGTLQQVHDQLRQAARAAAGRGPRPTAAVIDSQSVRAADTVPKASRGWDNAKKVNGRKRHIAVDTTGLLPAVVVTAACIQDRDAAKPLLFNLRRAFPGVKLTWADSGYAGQLVTWAATRLTLTLTIVNRPDDCHTFIVGPAAGSWNEHSPGSAPTAAAPATTSACPPATKPWSCGPWSPS